MHTPKDKVIRIYLGVRDKWTKYTRFALWFKIMVVIPTLLWLMLFNFYVQIPIDLRPRIDVSTLPTLESFVLSGYSLQTWPRSILPDNFFLYILDFLAAFVYLIHFFFAWIFALFLYIYHRNRKTPQGHPVVEPWTFLLTMGILNILAVATQISWPTAPPWYVELYGEDQEANYDITGDEAGLSRVDNLLQVSLFQKLYGQSPIVFGSFPSLHAAWPIVITIFSPSFRFVKVVGGIYTAIVWWAAMYLNHHFFVDLLGGAIFTAFAYVIATQSIAYLERRWRHKIYSKGYLKWTVLNAGQVITKEKEDEDEDEDEVELVINIPDLCPEVEECWTPSKQRRTMTSHKEH